MNDTFTCDVCEETCTGSSKLYRAQGGVYIACSECWPSLLILGAQAI